MHIHFIFNSLEGDNALYVNYRYIYVLSYSYNHLYISKICYVHVKLVLSKTVSVFFF